MIGQCESGVPEHFDAVVAIGIVRGGDHDSRGEVIGAGEIGDAGSGNYTGEAHVDAAAQKSAGYLRGDPRAGFASIHANDHTDSRREAAEVGAQSHAKSVDGGRVERILARQAANTVGAEELFAHLFHAVFGDGNFDCNAGRVLKAHAGIVHVGVDVIVGDARHGLQIDGVSLD